MKTKEVRDLSREDLIKREKDLKKELFEINYQRKLGNVEKPARFKKLRGDIARIQTILRERELQNERNRK